MLANIALSLYYYVRVLVPLYLRPSTGNRLQREPAGLRIALLLLGFGTLISGVLPQVWVAFATHSSSLFMLGTAR
jgi:NADH:ubiquinone oxidoreductase subunit 2 (subunit N)